NPSNNLRSILNVTGTINGTSSVTVEDGASLSGTGSINTTSLSGLIVFKNGGRLAAGDAYTGTVGTLTLGGHLSFEAGAEWELQFIGTTVNSVNLIGTIDSLDNVSLVAGETFNPVNDIPYWLLLNDGVDSITGGFANLSTDPNPALGDYE